VSQIHKESNLAFSDVNRTRRLRLIPWSPCVGVATGLLKTPRTLLKNRQKWHSIDTIDALDTGMQRQDKVYVATRKLCVKMPMQK